MGDISATTIFSNRTGRRSPENIRMFFKRLESAMIAARNCDGIHYWANGLLQRRIGRIEHSYRPRTFVLSVLLETPRLMATFRTQRMTSSFWRTVFPAFNPLPAPQGSRVLIYIQCGRHAASAK